MDTEGNRIRQLRKMRRMTLEQLSLAVGSDTGNLSRIERGKQSYSETMLRALANALGVAVADFFEERSNVEPASIGSRRVPLLDYVQAGKWTGIREDADTNPEEYLLTDLQSPAKFSENRRSPQPQGAFLFSAKLAVFP